VFATFSGPIATVLAAGTVAGITYKFANIQAEIAKSQRDIAKSQRDIAYDKLKSDLFRERYEIFSVAGELIDYSLGVADRKSGELLVMYRKLNEARFFFPAREAIIFGNVGRLVHKHQIAPNDILLHKDNEEKTRVGAGDRATVAAKELMELRGKLTELLQSELGFSQLTTARP
jgi:hypothetical protein